MESLRDKIARLRSLSPKLNAATDEAARLVLAVENFLNVECKFGIPAAVEFAQEGGDQENPVEYGKRLEYARIDGKFCIAVSDYESFPHGETSISNRMAWADCPRHVKLETIEWIPRLLDRIASQVEWTIRNAEERSETVRSYLKDFGVVSKEGE